MSGVTFDPAPQASPQTNRSRSGRDAAPASDDGFGLLIDGDADTGAVSRTSSATADRRSQSTSAERDPSAPATSSVQDGQSHDGQPADDIGSDAEAAHPGAADTAGSLAMFATLQANAATTPDTVIQSSETIPTVNPSAKLPGETAALALARVAQDVDGAAAAAPASPPAQTETAPAAADQPAAVTPAVLAPDQADDNAALTIAADLATRIPAEATVAEADAKLQAAAVAAPEEVTEHGRMIALAAAQTQPAPPRSSTQQETPALTPGDDQAIAKPDEINAGTANARPDSTGHHARDASAAEPAPPARLPAAVEATAPAQSPSTDRQAAIDIAPAALPAPQVSAPVPQLTVAPAHPNITVPVTALAVEIAANVQIGRSRFEIRLDPPELGRIEVKLDVDRLGQVTSHIIVEKPATLDLLRRDAPQLERALQDAGLKTSDNGLQFSLRDQQSQSGRHDQDDGGRNGQRLTIVDDESAPRAVAGNSYGRMLGSGGGIDMRV